MHFHISKLGLRSSHLSLKIYAWRYLRDYTPLRQKPRCHYSTMAPYQQTTASSDGTSGEAGATVLKARAYQQEMLDESLRQNIIVAAS